MATKTFTIAGIATDPKGNTALRFTNDPARNKAFKRSGYSNIYLYEMPEAMEKHECVGILKQIEDFMAIEVAATAIDEFEHGGAKRVGGRVKHYVSNDGERMFTVAGVAADHRGNMKTKFSNDIARGNALERDGFEQVHLVELKAPMTKYDAIISIMGLEEYDYIEAQQAFDDFLSKNGGTVAKLKPAIKTTIVEDVVDDDVTDVVEEVETVTAEVAEELEDEFEEVASNKVVNYDEDADDYADESDLSDYSYEVDSYEM